MFDENVQLKEQVKKMRKEKQETIAKIKKKLKFNKQQKFDRKRVELTEKLKTKQKQLDITLKKKSSYNCYERVGRGKTF